MLRLFAGLRLASVLALAGFVSPALAQGAHQPTFDADSGPALRWEGSFGDVASFTGNKNFALELFSWTARGGMEMDFTLYHNNRSTHNSELGHKWTHSYDIYLGVEYGGGPGDPLGASISSVPSPIDQITAATIHWGTDGACRFTTAWEDLGAVHFNAPAGIYDRLVGYKGENNIDYFELTTKAGTVYKFTNPTGFQWGCQSITDRRGEQVFMLRNAQQNVRNISDPTNRDIQIGFGADYRISTVTDPLNRVWTLQYNAAGELYRVNWPQLNGQTHDVEFAYDAEHNLTGFRDRRGNWWTHGYQDGRIVWSKDPLLNTWSFAGSTMTDPNNRTWSHGYSFAGELETVIDPLNHTTNYGRDENHNPTSVTDRRGQLWQYTYDAKGNVTSETTPLNHLWEWTWNAQSDLLTAQTPLNHTTTFTYDGITGKLLTETDPLNHQTSYQWGTSVPANRTNALNFTTHFGYDTHGHLTSVTDPNTNQVQATYNALGEVLTQKDGLLNETVYTRDAWGRVTQATIGGVTVFTAGYDLNDNLVWYKDGLNNQTTTVYDAANRVTSVTNGRSDVITYTWDAVGKKGLLSSKTNGNNQTTVYSYTARNEKASNAYPDGTSESWTYGPEGEVLSHTDGKNQLIQYQYDDSGRLFKIDYPTGIDTTFTWDASDRRTQMVDSTGTTTWTFDAADRLTQIQSPNGTVSYGYDNADRRTSTTVTGQGTWSYTLDPGDRVTSILNPYSESTTWLYNAADLPTQQTFGSGAVTTFQYDYQLRTTDVWHKTSGGATLGRYQYTYNSTNLTSRSDNDGSVTSFGYDGANQLTSEVRSGPGAYTIGYLYDNNGNRTQKTLNGVPEVYTYGNNDRILTAGGRSYGYDNNGNITSVTVNGQATTLTYDFENRVTRIDYPGGSFNTFKYNGLGLRVQKVDSSGTQNYVTDGSEVASPVLVDTSATYTPGISERRAGVSKFYHPDHLGSTRGITNSSQSATDSMLHDAFGSLVGRTGTTPTPFGYVGQEQYQTDSDSGLMLLGHRYYDSYIGRFISQDPIGEGANWYGYAANAPQEWVDPEGLFRAYGAGGQNDKLHRLAQALARLEQALRRARRLPKSSAKPNSPTPTDTNRQQHNDNSRPHPAQRSGEPPALKVVRPNPPKGGGANDKPSWVTDRPRVGESDDAFARRVLDDKYGGRDKWNTGRASTGPGSEFSQISKWANRRFMDPPEKK